MAPPKVGPRRARLGGRLRELRVFRFPSGSALARELGWPQTKVSKLERGAQLPSQADIDAWVAATGASEAVAAELTELLGHARLDYRPWGESWRRPGGIADIQDEIAEIDSRATRIGEYQPAIVPGIVQTPAYARELLSVPGGPVTLGAAAGEVEELVAARVRRQNLLLYGPDKRIQILMGEAALHTRFGPPDVLLGQLDRLISIAGLSTVELGVLRFAGPNPIAGLAGFALNDSDKVWVETLTGEQRIDAPDEVSAYVQAFEFALSAAAVGDEAAEVIRAAMQQVREGL